MNRDKTTQWGDVRLGSNSKALFDSYAEGHPRVDLV